MTIYKLKTYNAKGILVESREESSSDFMLIVRKLKKLLPYGFSCIIIDKYTNFKVCRVFRNGYEILKGR